MLATGMIVKVTTKRNRFGHGFKDGQLCVAGKKLSESRRDVCGQYMLWEIWQIIPESELTPIDYKG